MRAVVLYGACAASSLKVEVVPTPKARPGWVLVKVRAFGLNHSELIMRKEEADAPYIHLPRIMGIECVGEIEDPSDSSLRRGQKVVALMGGMGRSFDGSYAEYALLPRGIVFAVESELSWPELAAIPETYFTAYSSLFACLQLEPSDSILIRGATSAAGLAAVQLAKSIGCSVLATTRSPRKLDLLVSRGADYPLLDDDSLAERLLAICPGGAQKALDLVGPATLLDTMKLVSYHGIACDVGTLGGQYTLDGFDPIKDIPAGVYLSSFYSNSPTQGQIDRIFLHIKAHGLKPAVATVFDLEEIAKAHELLDHGDANGKIVVRVET
jgi:NADPH:quinone reductase-like Zn-dependent oxidoreductase